MLYASLLPLLMLTAAHPANLGPVPAGTLRVYLMRHAEAYSNLDPQPKMSAQALDALTEKGHRQARALGVALASVPFAVILHSPAGRARETAEHLRAGRQLEVQASQELRPMEIGQDQSGAPLALGARVALWQAGQDPRPLKGESLADAGERVRTLLLALHKAHAGRAVLCVSHSEMLGSFLGALRGKAPAARYPFGVGLASVTVIDVRAPDGFGEVLTGFELPAR
jgi:probable phosphoglycerate mutase